MQKSVVFLYNNNELSEEKLRSFMAQQKPILLGTMRLQVPSLAPLIGLRIRRCYELWYWSQTRLRYGIAVAVV